MSASENRDRPFSFGFVVVSVVVGLATTAIFFRDFLASHGNLIAGDTGDSRFIIAILEHWRAVVHGQASFTSPNFFWPERGVLGYSESLFLMAVPYGVLRGLGLDHYLAFEIGLAVFRLIGFFSMLWLLRAFARVSRPIAVVGATLFSLSNLYYMALGHSQLMTAVFVPLMCSFAVKSWQESKCGNRTRSVRDASITGLLLALVLFTSFYVGWFTMLAGATVLIVFISMRIVVNGGVASARECAKSPGLECTFQNF